MFHFDANVYGNPSYTMNQTQEHQFLRGGANDVGRGLYREFNPTGPIPITLRYEWDDTTFSAFRTEWGDASKINHGASWFTIDLPLMLSHDVEADTSLFPYLSKTGFFHSVTLGSTASIKGFRGDLTGQTTPLGGITGQNVLGGVVGRATMEASNAFRYQLDSSTAAVGVPFRGNGTDPVDAYFVESDETITLVWNASAGRYNATAVLSGPDWWAQADGSTRNIVVYPRTQLFQRYTVHIKQQYSAQMVGYNRWDVRLDAEVDVARKLTLAPTGLFVPTDGDGFITTKGKVFRTRDVI